MSNIAWGGSLQTGPVTEVGWRRSVSSAVKLQRIGLVEDWPEREGVVAKGNVDLMVQRRFTALSCSVRCPGELILKTYDLARALRDAGTPVVGGFHTPMEKECLRLLLRGQQPVIVCAARGIENMRIPAEWRQPLDAGRLLVLSPFTSSQRRATADSSEIRNDFVASLASQVLIAYAASGGKTEAFARKVLDSGKPLLTLESSRNANLVALGAREVSVEYVAGGGLNS